MLSRAEIKYFALLNDPLANVFNVAVAELATVVVASEIDECDRLAPAVAKDKTFLGGNILPGVRLAMEALEMRTAQLPSVEIVPMKTAFGRTTIESIQSGLYWSNVGMIRELVQRITDQVFADEPPLVIGTGGFVHLFDQEKIFDHMVGDLILTGLLEILALNQKD